jgi:hypothetical protein
MERSLSSLRDSTTIQHWLSHRGWRSWGTYKLTKHDKFFELIQVVTILLTRIISKLRNNMCVSHRRNEEATKLHQWHHGRSYLNSIHELNRWSKMSKTHEYQALSNPLIFQLGSFSKCEVGPRHRLVELASTHGMHEYQPSCGLWSKHRMERTYILLLYHLNLSFQLSNYCLQSITLWAHSAIDLVLLTSWSS